MNDLSPQQQKSHMRRLFGDIAPAYDRLNRLLSLGQDIKWRERALAKTHLPPDGRLLDVATGTGDLAYLAARRFPHLHIVGVDLTRRMLAVARSKNPRSSIAWVQDDGLRLAFPDARFDAVISAFMMRNVPDVRLALQEQVRVVKPGGRVVCLEMTWPRRFPMSWAFYGYFFGLTPLMGWLLAGNRSAYLYLPESVRRFRTPEQMADTMRSVGLIHVQWQAMMLGTVILYWGEREP